jgi:transcriptional regulator GlxA family with amidase domain
MCPNSEALYRIPQNNRFVSVCIPNWRLRPAVETMTDQSLDTLLASTRVAPLEAGVLSQLHRQMQQAMALSAQAATEASTQALAEIEQYLIGALALALTAPDEAIPRRINQRRQVFLRARDYIHGNLAAPLGLEILALETGVSLRTLRNSFQQVLGISPLHYIKLRRLNAARRLLLAGYPGELSVTEAAMRCGFSHMSYFARDYRELFGESPAQTLAGSTETKGVRS